MEPMRTVRVSGHSILRLAIPPARIPQGRSSGGQFPSIRPTRSRSRKSRSRTTSGNQSLRETPRSRFDSRRIGRGCRPKASAATCSRRSATLSRDELAVMYKNLKGTRVSDFGVGGAADNVSYWTSTQQTTDMANHIDFAGAGRQHYHDKDFPRRVRAIRSF